jgi:hypothetical protein
MRSRSLVLTLSSLLLLIGPASIARSNSASWVSEIQLASGFGDENQFLQSCCFDYTGTPEPDDGLGALLELLDSLLPGFDVTRTVNQSIVEDRTTMLIDWIDLPDGDGDVTFAVLFGEHTEDTSGFSAEDFDALYAERLAGGVFRPLESASESTVPMWLFDNGTRVGSRIQAGPATLPVWLDLPVLGFVQLDLLDAMVAIYLHPGASNPPATIDLPTPNACVTPPCQYYDHFDGMLIGGVISMEDLVSELDELVVGERDPDGAIIDPTGTCACAWGDEANGSDSVIPDDFALVTKPKLGRLVPSCTGELPNDGFTGIAPGFTCRGQDPDICDFVRLVCLDVTSLSIALTGVPDVDLPGGPPGVREGISVGMFASMTGATVLPEPTSALLHAACLLSLGCLRSLSRRRSSQLGAARQVSST